MSPYDQFLLFGDSLLQQSCSQTRGFAFTPALQDAFIRRLDIINRGFNGYNTLQALRVLPEFLPRPEQATIRFMMVFFGANDACLPGSDQHVPLEDYKENLRKILQHPSIQAQGPRLILVTPPPVNEYALEETDAAVGRPYGRTAEHTKLYADACREVGHNLGIFVLDLWSWIITAGGYKAGSDDKLPGSKQMARNTYLDRILSDGLHFNPLGYQVLYEATMASINSRWPDQMPENLPLVHPPWRIAPKSGP